MNNKLLLLIPFILFSIIHCDSATSSDIDGEGLDLGFTVIVDSSFYRLSATHNSHIHDGFSNSIIPYIPVFDLKVRLNEPSRRNEINKIIIYDDQQYGWEFTRNQLEQFFSDADSTYNFTDLLFKPAYELNDKLFFVRVIGDENIASRDYNFIFKGDYPLFTNSTNYWTSSENLELEYSVYSNNNSSTGYSPFQTPDSISLVWLDANKEILNSVPQIKDDMEQSDYNWYFYSYYKTNSIPDNAVFTYTTISEYKYNSEYQLITAIDPIINRLPFVADFFELDEYDQRIIFADDEFVIFLIPYNENPNQYSSLYIYDLSLNEKVDEITVFGRFYDENNLVHFNPDLQNLYFFDQNGEASFFNLESKLNTKTGALSNSQYYNYVLPFGDQIIFYSGNQNYLFSHTENSFSNINFNVNFSYYNSYLYSDVNGALYLGDEEGENFFKITSSDSINFIEERNYRDNNLSTYSNGKQRLHYSSSDSSIIHTSGAVLSIKNSVSFSSDSALTILPSISGFASGWIDEENLLVVLDFQSDEQIRVLKKTENGFVEYGYLESFGNPTDIFIDDLTIKISSLYNQGNNRQPKTILVSYSLDDIKPYSDLEKTNSRYTKMKKVSLN